MRQLFAIIALVIQTIASASFAQDSPSRTDTFRVAHGDFLRLATGEGKDIEFRYLFEPDHDLKEQPDTNLALDEFLLSADVPIVISRDFFLRTSTFYSARIYDFHSLTLFNSNVSEITLHKAQLGLGFGYFFNDNLLLTGMAKPGILSNFSSQLYSDVIKIYGESFVVYRPHRGVEVIGGIVSNELFEHLRVYPVVALRLSSPDNLLHLSVTPPVSVRLDLSCTESLNLYSGFFLSGDRYRIKLRDINQQFDVQIQDKRLGGGVLYYLTPHWNVSAESGVTLTNKFDLKIGDTDFANDRTRSSLYAFWSLGYAL